MAPFVVDLLVCTDPPLCVSLWEAEVAARNFFSTDEWYSWCMRLNGVSVGKAKLSLSNSRMGEGTLLKHPASPAIKHPKRKRTPFTLQRSSALVVGGPQRLVHKRPASA